MDIKVSEIISEILEHPSDDDCDEIAEISDYDDDRDDDYYPSENESEGDGDLLVESGIFLDHNFMRYFLTQIIIYFHTI